MTKQYNLKVSVQTAKLRSKRLRLSGGTARSEVSSAGIYESGLDLSRYLEKELFDDMFEKVQVGGQWVIRAKYGFYSNQFISALGLVQGDLGGGTGTGGSLFGLMRSWPSLDPGPSTQEALGANLGWELRGRIAALETAGYATQNWVLNKNYLTAHQDISHLLSKTEAASLYQPKGNYLTSHQSLSHLLRIDGTNGTHAGVSTLIGKLSNAAADVLDSTKFVTSDQLGDATSKLYYRRPATALWNYIKGKADAVYQPKGNYALASALGNYYTKTEVNTKLTDGSVTKVGTATVGASNWPIYLNNGVPYACSWKFGNYNGAAAVNNGTLNENLNADLLDGLHVGEAPGRVARFYGFPGYTSFGYEGTADTTYFSYLLKKLATDNSGEIMAVGRAHPNSQGVFIMHGYTGRKNGYPQYGSGLYVSISGRVVPIRVYDGIYTYGDGIFEGNAASASRLQTTGTYTAWGQTYFANGVPQSVSGNMTGVGEIRMNNALWFTRSGSQKGAYFSFDENGNGGLYFHEGYGYKDTCFFFRTTGDKLIVNGTARVTALRLGDILIEEDKANGGLKISGGVYATKYVSALGLATGNLSGGGSTGGGSAYDRLDAWADYTTDKAGYVLSAGLGADLNSRVGANATSINSILSRLNSLEGGGTTSVTVTGSGNAITDISKGGTAIIATKGATFLTQHQALDHINVKDIRNTAPKPNAYVSNRVTAWFNNSDKPVDGLSEWYSGINVLGWASSNYASWQLAATATTHLTDNNLYFRVGLGASWDAWQKILTSANYASVLGSVYQAKGDYVTVAGSQTVTGAKTFSGGLLMPYSAGTWISMAKRADQILGAVPTTGASAHSLFTLLNSSGAAISYGGLGVNIGFYGFYKARMDSGENSYDWTTTWNVNTGRLTHSGDLVAHSFIKNGGTSSQFLMANGSVTTKTTATAVTTLGWTSNSVDSLRIPDISHLAYWNGCYAGTSSNLQYCDKGRFGDIVTQSLSGLDSRYVKKAGDTMTGALTLPRLNIVGSAASSAFLTADSATNAFINVGGKSIMAWDSASTSVRSGSSQAGQVSLGTSAIRWSNVYATTINVTSTGLVSNLNADMLDGKHYSQMASGAHARYTPAGPAAGRWIRIAKSNTINNSSIYNAYAIISLTNSWYNNPTQGITFAVHLGYRTGAQNIITQLGGNGGGLWPKARIVYPTAANTAYYIEVYYNTTSILNEIGVEMTGSFNMELYDTYTAGEIPSGYAAKEQPLTVGVSAERFTSSVGTGTAPLTVASTTLVSNLNADLLDGLHYTAFSRADQSPAVDLNTVNGFGIMCNPANANATAERHYPTQEAGTLFYGTAAYSSANQIYSGYYSNRWFARGGGSGVNNKTSWREFAFTDSNVASATKLQTARTFWGQGFDGSANVSGSLSDVGSITPLSDTAYNIGAASSQFRWIYANGLYAKTGSWLGLGANNADHIRIHTNGHVSIGATTDSGFMFYVAGNIYADSWLRTSGNVGWYSQTHGGGIYMTDTNWVRVYNNKGLRVQEGVGLGPSGFIVGLKLHGASHNALEVSAGNYTMGLGCHSNGSWYWWRGTANPDSTGNKSYVMQYDGSVWNFTGQLRCDSLRIKNAVFTYDEANNGIKLDKGLYSEGYLSALGLSELTNTKFTISAGYESDALTILGGAITRSGYSGDVWNKGYGALNVAIDTSVGDSKQTPLLLAFSAGATDLNVNTSRLFALELLNNGDTLDFKLAGEVKLSINKIGLSAWSATLNYINATSIGAATVTATGKITCQSLTQTSDMRLKNVVRPMDLSVEAIAKAPSFIHRWKRGGAFDLGSSAQYWEEMSPLFTPRDKDGFLTMQYGKAALLSAIAIARRTVSHEERIRILESENKKLRAELNGLKARLRA